MKDYRKLFKKHYNIEFSSNFVVHHIDLNHENNDINNLMILPKKLHQKYHFLLTTLNVDKSSIVKFETRITGNCANTNTYRINMIEKLAEVLTMCNMWYDYKLYMDKKIPNIHDLEVF